MAQKHKLAAEMALNALYSRLPYLALKLHIMVSAPPSPMRYFVPNTYPAYPGTGAERSKISCKTT